MEKTKNYGLVLFDSFELECNGVETLFTNFSEKSHLLEKKLKNISKENYNNLLYCVSELGDIENKDIVKKFVNDSSDIKALRDFIS